MNQNQKKMQLNRTLSIALSLLVVTAITITVIAVVSARRAKPGDQSTETTDTSSQTKTTQTTQTTETTSQNSPVIIEKVSFLSPVTVGNVIKEWSADIPVFSSTMEDYRVHLGIDVEAEIGSPVYAVADGTIESVEFHPMMGQTVVIRHADGYQTIYQNMQTAVPNGIEAGASVRAGDEIGYIGDTALLEISEEPHLHFEIYKDDICENPLAHFQITPIDPTTHFEDN